MKIAGKIPIRALLVTQLLLAVAGCAQVSVQGGEKPIHMIVDVNIKVDRELDQFFAFEKQVPTTQPASTQTATTEPATTAASSS